MTAFKSILFFLLVPCLLLGVLPYWLMLNTTAILDLGVLRWTAILLWFDGTWIMVWCFYDFTFKGRGTPAPIDPPKELVVSGPYRVVRNPMYFAGAIVLMGYFIWRPSFSMMVAWFLFMLAAHLFVVFYEEPTLRKKFSAAYEEYCRNVPRWGRLFGWRI